MDHDSCRGRRRFLIDMARLAGGAGIASVLVMRPATATPAAMAEAIRQTVGATPPKPGRVKLEIPPLVENGNTVPITVSVDSPMTQQDHVTAIHVFNEKNPQPYVISVDLGPQNGRAMLSTRIKLADSQKVMAIARMSDGSLWSDSADVIVTMAACVEDVPG
ncbi:SoxY-related AACIE arm protein [Telmatospirillum sp.]|uniref:SoxY-related AACIE arm protein n=1 Tax=Telmatospirillum sp. TaxID=2079197 RepID=UPI002847D93C|nr:SoxY-related AACIE arm protein [Telmatospirillum sp.]MDR3435519.1 SoxY-related AACIE arm protein [Telmatospirillum sp.]